MLQLVCYVLLNINNMQSFNQYYSLNLLVCVNNINAFHYICSHHIITSTKRIEIDLTKVFAIATTIGSNHLIFFRCFVCACIEIMLNQHCLGEYFFPPACIWQHVYIFVKFVQNRKLCVVHAF